MTAIFAPSAVPETPFHPPSPGYGELKSELLQSIDVLIESIPACLHSALALRDKLQTECFDVLTVGQFKRGKTSLINALLGENLLPTAAIPLTSVVTILTHGNARRIAVHFLDGSSLDVHCDQLIDYVTESGNPGNEKGVREVVIQAPSALLENGVRILDTPGVGSVFRHNTDTAYARLPRCDAALFVLSADQPVGEAELDFLREVERYAGRIFFLLNKIDCFEPRDLADVEAFSRKVLRDAMGTDVRLYPVSAKQALQGKAARDPELLENSRLPAFTVALEHFLVEEKGKLLLFAVIDGLFRILAQARLEIGLERQSLTASIEELEEKMAHFAVRREAMIRDKRRIDRHLRDELGHLAKTVIEGNIQRHQKEQRARLGRQFDGLVLRHEDLSPEEFDPLLESFIRNEVTEAYSGWREAQEERIAEEFERVGTEFNGSVAEMVNELQRFASDLFRVPFEPVAVGAHWPGGFRIAFRITSEPVGLELLAEHAVRRWPSLIGNRFGNIKNLAMRWARRNIAKRRRCQLHETVEMLAGRIRSDFLQRLDRGRATLSGDLTDRLNRVADGIEQALQQGRRERAKTAEESEQHRLSLERQLAAIDATGERLQAIRVRVAAM